MQYFNCALDMSFLLLLYKDISPPVDRKELLLSTQPHSSHFLGAHTRSSPEDYVLDHDDNVEDGKRVIKMMVMISKDLTRLARWFEYLGSLVLSVFFQLKLETLK